MEPLTLDLLWARLGFPLLRLVGFVSLGLLAANLIEALNWTRAMARLAQPLVRLGRLQDISGASFSMAFFSGVAANTMLAEAWEQGKLNDRELLLSNLFNSLPTYFLHLPTMFFITWPFLGSLAVVYVSLTLSAAFLRSAAIVLGGRLFLPPLPEGCVVCRLDESGPKTFGQAVGKALKRFRKRLPKILFITVPIYTAVFFANRYGLFDYLEELIGPHAGALFFLDPKALSIVLLQLAAEFSAGLATAAQLLSDGSLAPKDVILALLLGNVLSSPMRALRHQFPYYAGIFKPKPALKLITVNQTMRALSILAVAALYYLLA